VWLATVFCVTWVASIVWLWNAPISEGWEIGLMPQDWGAVGPSGRVAQVVLAWILLGSATILLAMLWGVATLIHTACLRVTKATKAARAQRRDRPQVDPASLAWHERCRPLLIAGGIAAFLIANNPTEDDLARWVNQQVSPREQPANSSAGRAGQALGMAMAPALVRSITTRYNLLLGSVFLVRLNGGGGVFLGAAHQIIPLWRAPAAAGSG
jgi:hypothetical protein